MSAIHGTQRVAVWLLLGASAALAATSSTTRAEFDGRFDVKADSLVVHDLIGEVRVEGHDGSSFEVELHARGRDATRENLTVELEEGSHAELSVRFPLERENDYVYPRMGRGSRARFTDGGGESGLSGLLTALFGGSSSVRVSGSGGGLELWADVTVRVPRDKAVTVRHGVGKLVASQVRGTIELDTHFGTVEARSVTGPLTVDAGSGQVTVAEHSGDLSVDVGSGGVELDRVSGAKVTVDTGSGRVRLGAVEASAVLVDTGSGGVSGSGLSADDLSIDTGSGSVDLEFGRVGSGRFTIDTGSGSIRLVLPAGTSARISAETGSGGIDVDFEGAEIDRPERDEAKVTLGGGAAQFDLSTGSGSIQISRAG
jgi:hypothetical protein